MSQNLFKARGGTLYVRKLHPKRDWLVGVFIGVCIALAVVGWSGYIYLINRDGGFSDEEVVISNPTYQAALMDEAREIFKSRGVDFNRIAGTYVSELPVPAPETDSTVATSTASSTPSEITEEDSETSESVAESDVSEEGIESEAITEVESSKQNLEQIQ